MQDSDRLQTFIEEKLETHTSLTTQYLPLGVTYQSVIPPLHLVINDYPNPYEYANLSLMRSPNPWDVRPFIVQPLTSPYQIHIFHFGNISKVS